MRINYIMGNYLSFSETTINLLDFISNSRIADLSDHRHAIEASITNPRVDITSYIYKDTLTVSTEGDRYVSIYQPIRMGDIISDIKVLSDDVKYISCIISDVEYSVDEFTNIPLISIQDSVKIKIVYNKKPIDDVGIMIKYYLVKNDKRILLVINNIVDKNLLYSQGTCSRVN